MSFEGMFAAFEGDYEGVLSRLRSEKKVRSLRSIS